MSSFKLDYLYLFYVFYLDFKSTFVFLVAYCYCNLDTDDLLTCLFVF